LTSGGQDGEESNVEPVSIMVVVFMLILCSDSRIPALIRNGAQEKKRSFFVVVGDRQKDVIVNLYHILLNVDLKLNKSVLWAYKNKLLGFSR